MNSPYQNLHSQLAQSERDNNILRDVIRDLEYNIKELEERIEEKDKEIDNLIDEKRVAEDRASDAEWESKRQDEEIYLLQEQVEELKSELRNFIGYQG